LDTTSQLNRGILPLGDTDASPDDPATIIVTGIARSGTSMVASVLRSAGLPMGEVLHAVVEEDAEILAALQSGHDGLLRDLIRRRDARWPRWGFKVPNLHAYLLAERMAWFRRPRLVVIYRDPLAVAVRSGLSEHFNAIGQLTMIGHALTSLTAFVRRANCPTLLLSYEKVISAPDDFLDNLLPFCGLSTPREARAPLLRAIRPNNPAYLATAFTTFKGNVERIVNGSLHGWCHQVRSLVPVQMELLVDGDVVLEFQADQFREDLAASEIGNGCHGFFVDLKPLRLSDECRLSVRVRKRTVVLDGSDRTVAELAVALARQPETVA
jgi:hypothetical protein